MQFVVYVNDTMPVKVDIVPPPPANSKQPGVTRSLLYNGSKFQGHQKSKGNSYEVEVVLQVSLSYLILCRAFPSERIVETDLVSIIICGLLFQHVDEENSYLCGYLKIKGLTEEFPTLTTFFDGEIISKKYPFLTRKWDADEDVDKKHWVSL